MTRKNTTGQAERFRAVYDATYKDAFRFAARRISPDAAEDVIADAFTAVWRRIDDCPHDMSDARAWVFGVVRHCLMNAQRGSRRAEALDVRLASVHREGHVPSIDVSARIDFSRTWNELSAQDQEVLALQVLDGLTTTQAASVLGIPPTTYRMRLSRARRRLQDLIDSEPAQESARTPYPALRAVKDLSA